MKPEREEKLKQYQEKFIEKNGELARKRIEADNLWRQLQTRILFCQNHDLKNYLTLGEQPPPDDFVRFENVNFEGRVSAEKHEILMNAINGVEL